MWRPLVSMRPLLAEFGTKEDDRVTVTTAGTTPVIRIDKATTYQMKGYIHSFLMRHRSLMCSKKVSYLLML